MRKLARAAVAAVLLATAALVAQAAGSGPYAAAVADKTRPAEEVALDVARKPAETLAFAGVKRGDKVADYIASGGYFTHLFADVVGPKGHVYAVEPDEVGRFPSVAKAVAALKEWAKGHPNVTVVTGPAMSDLTYPEKLDVFWIAQNYHDLHDKFMGPVDIAAFNKAVYAALKPGGIYIVLDHASVKDAGPEVTESLHRINPDQVKREVEAAGFKFVGESKLLANPDDPHTANVFDKSIRHHTDQFIFKFRKPR
jgi:predicted methyltransferase